MDIKRILRLAYDGNYERAISIMANIIEKQQSRIEDLEFAIKCHVERIELLEKEVGIE